MAVLSLHKLVTSLANAVMEAQTRVEHFQIAALRSYFHPDGKPMTMPVKLPPNSQSQGEREVALDVPVIALVGANVLRIKEFDIEFAVHLHEVGDTTQTLAGALQQSASGNAAASLSHAHTHEPLLVDTNLSGTTQESTEAKIRIKVEGIEQTEGLARLLHHLYSRF
jgi:hypothetical protein